MGITYKYNDFGSLSTAEMAPETEQNYMRRYRAENARYVQEALQLTAFESGLYWTETDESVEAAARSAAVRRANIKQRIFSPINSLNKVCMEHQPLTPELVEERKASMLEAADIYRAAAHKFAGHIGEEYMRAVEKLEKKAEMLEVHDGAFNVSKYV